MARIRTIKPEFWTSEQIADCSLIARLLFIGIWNFCDDRGVHPVSIKRLKMEVFPSDQLGSDAIQAMIDELVLAGLLHTYQAAGKSYWQVTGWGKHQKIEKPTYRHPLPESSVEVDHSPTSAGVVGDYSSTTRRIVAEQSTSNHPRNGKESKGGKTLSATPDAVTILDYLNEKIGRHYKPVKANLSLIAARLRESSIDECRAVIDAKVAAWQNDDKMREYLRPATLFNPMKFANYVGELGSSSKGDGRDWE
jgi:uncharacterized phage protein (TIGR02220 family)